MIKVFRASAHNQMPWKNGLGISSQIDIFPTTASVITSDFLWRLSSAKVAGNNTFSLFPNHDRLLGVLSGGAIQLKFHDKQTDESTIENLIKPFSTFQFRGDREIDCELQGEPVVDLGLIYNRKSVNASMHFIDVKEKPNHLKLPDGINFIVCVLGSLKVNETTLDMLDTFKTEDPLDVQVKSIGPESKAALINIRNRNLTE